MNFYLQVFRKSIGDGFHMFKIMKNQRNSGFLRGNRISHLVGIVLEKLK